MEQKIIRQIKENVNTFFITSIDDNKSIIMLFFEYEPYKILNKKTHAMLDAYYLISNSSYHTAKNVAKNLQNLGLEANYKFDFNYKKLASNLGYTGVGKNTLTYLKNIGSRFVMQAIEIEGSYDYSNNIQKIELNCQNCNLCKNACPTGAIKEKGFDRHKCLRHHQEIGEYVDDNTAKVMQNKLLGCDICQAVCPYNKSQLRVEVPSKLKEILELEYLLEVLKSEKNTKEIFGSLIGKNYAKSKRLLPQFILIAGNSRNKKLIEKLELFESNSNALIAQNASRAIKTLQTDKKH